MHWCVHAVSACVLAHVVSDCSFIVYECAYADRACRNIYIYQNQVYVYLFKTIDLIQNVYVGSRRKLGVN